MSKKFKVVKKFFDKGQWTVNQVRDSVAKNWITEEEFFEITGIEY